MKNAPIKKQIFLNHGIEVKTENRRLLILDVYFDQTGKELSNWIDATEWSKKQVYNFLGY